MTNQRTPAENTGAFCCLFGFWFGRGGFLWGGRCFFLCGGRGWLFCFRGLRGRGVPFLYFLQTLQNLPLFVHDQVNADDYNHRKTANHTENQGKILRPNIHQRAEEKAQVTENHHANHQQYNHSFSAAKIYAAVPPFCLDKNTFYSDVSAEPYPGNGLPGVLSGGWVFTATSGWDGAVLGARASSAEAGVGVKSCSCFSLI